MQKSEEKRNGKHSCPIFPLRQKSVHIDPKMTFPAMPANGGVRARECKQHAISNLLHDGNVFSLIYTYLAGSLFPFVILLCLRRIINIVLHFPCCVQYASSHHWRRAFRLHWIVQVSLSFSHFIARYMIIYNIDSNHRWFAGVEKKKLARERKRKKQERAAPKQ